MTCNPSDQLVTKVLPGHPFFDLVEQAYQVFACPKPKAIGVCERCCMDAAIEADFFNPAIRELPLNYVRDWYSGAYDSNGVPKDSWTYLLPRILEILASGEEVSDTGLEVSLSRFETGNPEKCSVDEWAVLDAFQRMYLHRYIDDGRDNLDDMVCMFRLGGWPLEGLLNQVSSISDENLAHRLWRDWCGEYVPGGEGVWVTAFWEAPDNTTAFEFYTSRALHARMVELALSDDTNLELAAKASAIVTVIEANATWCV